MDLGWRRTPRSRPPQREVERFEKILKSRSGRVYHTFYVGSGAVRFYLPLNVAAREREFRAGRGGHAQLRSCATRCRRASSARWMMASTACMARVQPLALGPPGGLANPVSRDGAGHRNGVRRIAEQVATDDPCEQGRAAGQLRLERAEQVRAASRSTRTRRGFSG